MKAVAQSSQGYNHLGKEDYTSVPSKSIIDALKIQGDVIPNQLYDVLVDENGRTNTKAMLVYSNILDWYKPKKVVNKNTGELTYTRKFLGDVLKLKYDFLATKLRCSKETIRRALVFLEKKQLILRAVVTRYRNRSKSGNEVFVYLWKETPHFICDVGLNRNEHLKECNSVISGSKAHQALKNKNVEIIYPHTHVEIIDKNNNYNNNISRSEILNSVNILEDEEEAIALPEPETLEPVVTCEKEMEPEKEIASSTSPNLEQVPADQSQRQCRPKSINHCLELSEQDFESLRSSSKRKFNNNAIKQLLKHLAVKKPDLTFFNSKASLVYFSKFLANEKMSERICNMPGFVRVGYNSNSRSARVERFIEKLETTCQRDASKEDLLAKLLADTLAPGLIYDLCKDSKITVEGENLCFHLKSSTKIKLTDENKAEILNVANSIFQRRKREGLMMDVVFYYAKTKSDEELDIANTKRKNVVEKIQQLPGLTKGWERTLLDLALVSESFNVDPETVLQDFAQCELDEENTDKLYCTTNSPEHAQRLTQTYERYFKNIVCGHYGKKILISSFDDQGALRKFAEIESSGVYVLDYSSKS